MTTPPVITNGAQLDAEAVLDPAIVPQGSLSDSAFAPREIFFTGATGFVGAFLLRDLFETTSTVAHALVRAQSPEQGFERIKENLQAYNLWQDSYTERVLPVVGDLKYARFGLSPEAFQELAERVDAVYACGSKLSYVAPYHYLNNANVGGTEESLRLATQGKPKPVHFVSSLGILLAYEQLVGGGEDDDLDADKCPDVGYFQTKYVAERVVRIARTRGVPVTVHRIGLIVGDSQTGISNIDDFVARMLLGCIQAGFAPDIRNAMDMTPVDYVSGAMTYLSLRRESVGSVFHLLNPHPIHWGDIFEIVNRLGYPVKILPFHQWIDAIERHGDPETNPLVPMLPFFHIKFAQRMLGINESHFRYLGTESTLQALSAWGKVCPPVDDVLIGTFLRQFVRSGRLLPVEATAL